MATIYDDGTLYGDAGITYGRISAAMEAAQTAHVRETGLIVTVNDSRLNQWEYFAGEDLPFNYRDVNDAQPYEQGYYSFRGRSSICKLIDGTIVRARLGHPSDINNRSVYAQVITDPTDPAEWETWFPLYSGTHYSVTVVPRVDEADWDTYTSRVSGLYKNNASVPILGSHIVDFASAGPLAPREGFVTQLLHDVTTNPSVTRQMFAYHFPNVDDGGTFDWDSNNFRWFRNYIAALKLDDGRLAKIQVLPYFFSPRSEAQGYAVFVQFREEGSSEETPPYLLRGIGGGGGKNWYSSPYLTKLSDGYYYMVLSESHQAAKSIAPTADLTQIRVWSRSKDLMHWSEPVVGPAGYKMAGWVEKDDWVYWADNGRVWRRPAVAASYDISNYVIEGSLELPRDNQPSSGQLTVANPDNVNNFLRDLADQEITVLPGIKLPTGGYEYAGFDRFWIKQVNQQVDGERNQLILTIGNALDRLENKLKDIYNFVGKTEWKDWAPGRRNQPFNYYFDSDTNPTVDDSFRLKSKGIVLWTGWKGFNFDFELRLSSVKVPWQLIGRYVDKKNYIYLKAGSGSVVLCQVLDGVHSELDSFAVSGSPFASAFTIRWRQRWNFTEVWVNGSYLGDAGFMQAIDDYRPGYVGVKAGSFKWSQFKFEDLEYNLNQGHLIKTALALGDVHDVIVSGGSSKAYGIIWGPQTDIQTASDGLRTAMEADKLQIIYRNGSVEVGKFNDPSVVRILENRIIESERVDEPNRRINYSIVDGNEHSWIALDLPDTYRRGRSVVEYQDLPELLTQTDVRERAREDIRKSTVGASPGGTLPLFFDIHRMDHVLWRDNVGNEDVVRVEGITIEFNQGEQPYQRMTLDNSLIADDPTEITIEELLAEEEQEEPDDPEDET